MNEHAPLAQGLDSMVTDNVKTADISSELPTPTKRMLYNMFFVFFMNLLLEVDKWFLCHRCLHAKGSVGPLCQLVVKIYCSFASFLRHAVGRKKSL